jgi:CRISPR/Cas system CSM-associated protein Csm2 small subunit
MQSRQQNQAASKKAQGRRYDGSLVEFVRDQYTKMRLTYDDLTNHKVNKGSLDWKCAKAHMAAIIYLNNHNRAGFVKKLNRYKEVSLRMLDELMDDSANDKHVTVAGFTSGKTTMDRWSNEEAVRQVADVMKNNSEFMEHILRGMDMVGWWHDEGVIC